MGKLGLITAISSSVSDRDLGKNIPRIPFIGLKGFRGSQLHW